MKNYFSKEVFIVDLLSFGAVVIFANYMEWTAKDLLWSLWISSLVIGYSTLVLGLGANLVRGRMADEQGSENVNRNGKISGAEGAPLAVFFLIPIVAIFRFSIITLIFAVLAAISVTAAVIKYKREREGLDNDHFLINFMLNFPAGLFLLIFFTIHFGGFHFVHSIFLNGMFPILNETPFGKTPGQTGFFFFDLIEVSFSNYWLFIVASAASSFESIFKTMKGREINFMLEPYKNVVKMHLMIFVIAFAGMAGFYNFILYATLVLYFFPVGKMIRKKKTDAVSV
jgi:hypothetical protein